MDFSESLDSMALEQFLTLLNIGLILRARKLLMFDSISGDSNITDLKYSLNTESF